MSAFREAMAVGGLEMEGRFTGEPQRGRIEASLGGRQVDNPVPRGSRHQGIILPADTRHKEKRRELEHVRV
jgi:hypothetical protein